MKNTCEEVQFLYKYFKDIDLTFPRLVIGTPHWEQLYFRKTFMGCLLIRLKKGQILKKPLRGWVGEKDKDQPLFVKNVVTGLQNIFFFLSFASISCRWICAPGVELTHVGLLNKCSCFNHYNFLNKIFRKPWWKKFPQISFFDVLLMGVSQGWKVHELAETWMKWKGCYIWKIYSIKIWLSSNGSIRGWRKIAILFLPSPCNADQLNCFWTYLLCGSIEDSH